MNCNEEFAVKIIGQLTLEFNFDWDQQRKVREIINNSLYTYQVTSLETGLMKSDITEKLYLFIKIKELDGYSKKTLKNYIYVLNKFAIWIHKPLRTITKNDVRMFLIETTGNLKPSSKNTTIYVLKSFFSWLEAEEYIDKSPIKNLEIAKLPKRLRKSLTITELEKLRLACETTLERAMLEMFFATGCRLSEIIDMNISDLDFNINEIKVIGKGNKQRIVLFSDKTKLHLKNYLDERTDDNEALFVFNRKPYGRIKQRSIQLLINKIASRTDINKPVYPHLLRHTMATLSYDAGAQLTTIQHLLGHSSSATTQTYAEESIENIRHEYKQHFTQ